MNTPDKPLAELKKEALAGSIKSYEQLTTAQLDYAPEDYIFVPLIMANKYHYYPAYRQVFWNVLYGHGVTDIKDIGKIDEKTRKFIIDCLAEASRGKDAEAGSILMEISKIDNGRYYHKKVN